MIHINLIPGANKKRASSKPSFNFGSFGGSLSGRVKDKMLIGTVASVVVAVLAVGYLYTSQIAYGSELDARKDRALSDSTRYANFLKERWHAESVRDTLLRQVNIIKSLDEDRYVWSHVVDEVSRALPQYTWLTSVAYNGTPQGTVNVVATPKTAAPDTLHKNARPKRIETEIPREQVSVKLQGHTVDIQALTRFMKDLESSPFLSNVQLDRSELALELGKEVTQFQLTVGYNRPDTSAIRRVPLALPVR
jgi:type IV pilus assembly protein PilN